MSKRFSECYEPICPFYKSERDTIIRCEGITKDSYVENRFSTKKSFSEYKLNICSDKWKKCILAQGLWGKYEDKEIQ